METSLMLGMASHITSSIKGDAGKAAGTHLLATIWKPEKTVKASMMPTAHRVQTEDDLGTARLAAHYVPGPA
jgi:hypothetical protein